jgi:hypothetical protein
MALGEIDRNRVRDAVIHPIVRTHPANGRKAVYIDPIRIEGFVGTGYNEYELRKAREADIRQQVIQITKQFGEEIGEQREGARQLLLALAQLPA